MFCPKLLEIWAFAPAHKCVLKLWKTLRFILFLRNGTKSDTIFCPQLLEIWAFAPAHKCVLKLWKTLRFISILRNGAKIGHQVLPETFGNLGIRSRAQMCFEAMENVKIYFNFEEWHQKR